MTLIRTSLRRRAFLESLSVVGAAMLLPTVSNATPRRRYDPDDILSVDFSDPDLKALSRRAIDAAISAGATYADIRITRTNSKQLTRESERDTHDIVAGVRVLANGAWGFAAHSQIDADTMVWLGKTSTELAKANAWPNLPPVEIAQTPAVEGNWQTPIKIDPFSISGEERAETIAQLESTVRFNEGEKYGFHLNFQRQDRFFASSEESVTNQRIYTAFNKHVGSTFFNPDSSMTVQHANKAVTNVRSISPTGAGWEALLTVDQYIPEALEFASRLAQATPLDQPGQYEVVFDGAAMAALVSVLGQANEIDRVLGLEAESGQISFMAPVDEKFGQTLFPSFIDVTADRNMSGGAASVGWDDEGVVPSTFPVIKDGVLVDYGNGRESVLEVAEWYKAQGKTAKLHGCMTAAGAKYMPHVFAPNLTLTPSTQDTSFNDLLSGIKRGFAVLGGDVDMDNKFITGWGTNSVIFFVENGKLTTPVRGATYTFRMLDHWKKIVALGGQKTVIQRGFTLIKGKPGQSVSHTVRAGAARFKDVAIRSVELTRGF